MSVHSTMEVVNTLVLTLEALTDAAVAADSFYKQMVSAVGDLDLVSSPDDISHCINFCSSN